MHPSFLLQLLFPVALLIVQTYIFLFGTLFVLRKLQLVGSIVDMEFSQMIVAGSLLFGVFFISTADFSPLLQSFKLNSADVETMYSKTFFRFGQYFLDILAAQVVFILLTWLNVKIFLGRQSFDEVRNGSMPSGVFIGIVTLSFAVLTRFLIAEIIDYLTPKVVIFN